MVRNPTYAVLSRNLVCRELHARWGRVAKKWRMMTRRMGGGHNTPPKLMTSFITAPYLMSSFLCKFPLCAFFFKFPLPTTMKKQKHENLLNFWQASHNHLYNYKQRKLCSSLWRTLFESLAYLPKLSSTKVGRTSQLDMEDRCGNWGKEGTVGSVSLMARFGPEKVNTCFI